VQEIHPLQVEDVLVAAEVGVEAEELPVGVA